MEVTIKGDTSSCKTIKSISALNVIGPSWCCDMDSKNSAKTSVSNGDNSSTRLGQCHGLWYQRLQSRKLKVSSS